MLDNIPRFDMKKPPMRQHLLPLIWLLSFPEVIAHKNKLTKINMKGIKPPYLLLCNHNAFMDFKVATKAIFSSQGKLCCCHRRFLETRMAAPPYRLYLQAQVYQ